MLAAPGKKWHTHPPDVIPLWLADPDFPVAMEIKKALLNCIHDEDLFYSFDEPTMEVMAEKVMAEVVAVLLLFIGLKGYFQGEINR